MEGSARAITFAFDANVVDKGKPSRRGGWAARKPPSWRPGATDGPSYLRRQMPATASINSRRFGLSTRRVIGTRHSEKDTPTTAVGGGNLATTREVIRRDARPRSVAAPDYGIGRRTDGQIDRRRGEQRRTGGRRCTPRVAAQAAAVRVDHDGHRLPPAVDWELPRWAS